MGKIVEGELRLEASAEDLGVSEPEGQTVLVAVPQLLDGKRVALVIVGEAQIVKGVKLVP